MPTTTFACSRKRSRTRLLSSKKVRTRCYLRISDRHEESSRGVPNASESRTTLCKGEGFGHLPDTPIALPSWLSSKDIDDYNSKFEKTVFAGGLNYYRALDLNWELTAPWMGAQIKMPAKFVVGNQDLTYNAPGVKDFIHKGVLKKYVPLLDEVVVMECVAHFIHEERPWEVTQHIDEFFQKFRGGRGIPQVARKSCCIM